MGKSFFDEQEDQSRVKATIVAKYFLPWATIIGRAARSGYGNSSIQYVDLFCGPGRYKDGAKSTPLMVLDAAVKDPEIRKQLHCVFNDQVEESTMALQKAIDDEPSYRALKTAPRVICRDVDSELAKELGKITLVPTLFFVDPWGYKGLSNELVNAIIKDWGSECIIFFNYNRINMGLGNELVEKHMDALFGKKMADKVRAQMVGLTPDQRELCIVEAYCQLLSTAGRFVLPFRFMSTSGKRTSHHLIHVSKHRLGYDIMKKVMHKESSGTVQGVASFEYNPSYGKQGILFEYSRPLDDLEGRLLKEFAGREISVIGVFDDHNVGTPYILANYKTVLKSMYGRKVITAYRESGQAISRGFPDDIVVVFPE